MKICPSCEEFTLLGNTVQNNYIERCLNKTCNYTFEELKKETNNDSIGEFNPLAFVLPMLVCLFILFGFLKFAKI